MVSASIACLWAVAGILMGGAWGILTMALLHAAKDHKEDQEDDHGNS